MQRLAKIRYYSKKYAPEILTVAGVTGQVVSNILFVRAEKLYLEDGKKKHFLLPSLVSLGSITCIIASNRVSNAQKISIVAATGALATKYLDQRKDLKEQIGETRLAQMDCFEPTEAFMKKADETDEVPFDEDDISEQLFYLPQYGLCFYSTPAKVTTAELNLNEMFVHDGQVYLSEFFECLGFQENKEDPNDPINLLFQIGNNYGWRFNFEDYENGLQYITFDNHAKLVPYAGKNVVCNYIYFNEEALPMYEYDRIYGDEG